MLPTPGQCKFDGDCDGDGDGGSSCNRIFTIEMSIHEHSKIVKKSWIPIPPNIFWTNWVMRKVLNREKSNVEGKNCTQRPATYHEIEHGKFF